jgi:hypothetical protein
MSPTPKAKSYALDIFQVLDRINHNDFEYFQSLNIEQQKSIQPYVLMKWMLGTKQTKVIYRLNNRVNRFVFSLGNNHKELVFKLLCSVTDGRSQRYTWAKVQKKSVSAPNCIKLIQEFWGYNATHAKDAFPLLSDETILDIAQYLGKQSDELTKIKAELKSKNKGSV